MVASFNLLFRPREHKYFWSGHNCGPENSLGTGNRLGAGMRSSVLCVCRCLRSDVVTEKGISKKNFKYVGKHELG